MATNNEVFKAKLLEGSSLKSHVLVSVQSPTFYRSVEGQRFIIGLFGLGNISWLKEVHKAFKAVLPGRVKILCYL